MSYITFDTVKTEKIIKIWSMTKKIVWNFGRKMETFS